MLDYPASCPLTTVSIFQLITCEKRTEKIKQKQKRKNAENPEIDAPGGFGSETISFHFPVWVSN